MGKKVLVVITCSLAQIGGEVHSCQDMFNLMCSFLNCRKYHEIYDLLRVGDLEQIKELTNCLKPCRYQKYSFAADGQKTIFGSEKYVFSLWATSKHTKVSTEQLVHP